MAWGKSLALQCVSSLWHDSFWNPMWGHKLFECTLGVITWQSRNVWQTKNCCRTTVFQTASIATRWAPDLFHEFQLPSFLEDKMEFPRHIWCRCYIFIWCCRRVHWHLFVRNPSGTLTRLTSKTVLASEDHGGKKERGKKNIVWCSEINHHSLVRHLRGIQSTSKTSRLEHSFFPKCFWEGSPHIPAYG